MPVQKGSIESELAKMRKRIEQVPTQVGQLAKNFFVDGFDLQGWQGDSGLQAWKARKDTRNDRPILIKKGNLRKGLQKQVSGSYIAVKVAGAAAAYADVHNFGFVGTVSARSKTGKTFNRKMNMPKRQFIGNSKQLDTKIRKFIEGQFRQFK